MTFDDQMMQAIRDTMPANSDIRVARGIELVKYHVSWKLNNDPERPYKMSKTISICFSPQAIEEFSNVPAAQQDSVYKRITEFLAENLTKFDPQHDATKNEAAPSEQWIISPAVLLG